MQVEDSVEFVHLEWFPSPASPRERVRSDYLGRPSSPPDSLCTRGTELLQDIPPSYRGYFTSSCELGRTSLIPKLMNSHVLRGEVSPTLHDLERRDCSARVILKPR